MVVDAQIGEDLIRVNALDLVCPLARVDCHQYGSDALDDRGIALGLSLISLRAFSSSSVSAATRFFKLLLACSISRIASSRRFRFSFS